MLLPSPKGNSKFFQQRQRQNMANAAIMQTGGFQLLLEPLKGLRKGTFCHL